MTVIITGISSGIGFALASYYIELGVKVVGIGRSNPFKEHQLQFFLCDLSKVTDFSFLKEVVNNASELLLINNAGVIGSIERISEQKQSDIHSTIQVNTIAPMLLCQFVLQEFPTNLPLTIVNISSGAAQRAIPGWASYCASKLAIDRFSETIYLEEMERKRNVKIYSVAPGVVDTPMQEKIRKAKASSFSSLSSFQQLHAKNELTDSDIVVRKLQILLNQKYNGTVVSSLKSIEVID